MRYVLDTFVVGYEGGFQPAHVDGNYGMIDLRPDPTVVDGYCLVGTSGPVSGRPTLDFGEDDLDGRMNPNRRRSFGNRLGITVDQTDLRSIVAELLLVHGSFPDSRKWNPIRAERSGRHRIFLGSGPAIYDAPAIVGTTLSDSFSRPDETLATSANWTNISGGLLEIISNKLRCEDTTADSVYRYESDLDSDRHFVSLLVEVLSNSNSDMRVMTRFAPAASTYYLARIIASATSTVLVQKVVTGTPTNIILENKSAPTEPWTVKLESDGSTQTITGAGFTEFVTDSGITGNVRCGVGSRNSHTSDRGDNWLAEDLPGTPLTLTPDGDGTITALFNEVHGTTNLYQSIDEDPDSPTLTDWVTSGEGDGNGFFELSAMPTGFSAMLTPLTVRADVASTDFAADTAVLYAQVFAANESTAYTDEVQVATEASSGLVEVNLTVNATGLAASKALWNAARLRLRWDYTA